MRSVRQFGIVFILGGVLAFIAWQAGLGKFRSAKQGEPASKQTSLSLTDSGALNVTNFAELKQTIPYSALALSRRRELEVRGKGFVTIHYEMNRPADGDIKLLSVQGADWVAARGQDKINPHSPVLEIKMDIMNVGALGPNGDVPGGLRKGVVVIAWSRKSKSFEWVGVRTTDISQGMIHVVADGYLGIAAPGVSQLKWQSPTGKTWAVADPDEMWNKGFKMAGATVDRSR